MREFKFKVWDRHLKKMWCDVEFLFDHDGLKCIFLDPFNSDQLVPTQIDNAVMSDGEKRLIALQYVGKEDTNGFFIYEGDVVCASYTYNGEEEAGSWVGYVKYDTEDEHFAVLDNEDVVIFTFADSWDKRIEVIGNIYENPELMGEREQV